MDENKDILRPTLDGPAADNSHRSWSSRIFNEVDRRTNDGEVTMGKYIESCLGDDDRVDVSSIQHKMFYIPIGWNGGDPINGPELGRMAYVNFWVF